MRVSDLSFAAILNYRSLPILLFANVVSFLPLDTFINKVKFLWLSCYQPLLSLLSY